MLTKTLKLKVYPDDYAWLNAAAREVNQVFNFCNETSAKQFDNYRAGQYETDPRTGARRPRRALSGFDLTNLTAGYTEFCKHIGADTIQKVCTEYADKRSAADRSRLNWRVSDPSSPKHSLGWVPMKAASLGLKGTAVQFCGKRFRVHELKRIQELHRSGRTFVVVDHDMESILRISQRLVVMARGRKIADGPPEAVRTDQAVLAAYAGL